MMLLVKVLGTGCILTDYLHITFGYFVIVWKMSNILFLCLVGVSITSADQRSHSGLLKAPRFGPHIKTCSQPCLNKETIAGLAFKILLWCHMGKCLCMFVCV